jgi:hypothetical protein
MGKKRKIRLDADSLMNLLEAGLRDAGYLAGHGRVVELEYQTRTIKEGGDYYTDLVEPGYEGHVEVVKWIRVLTDTPDKKEDE